MVAAAAVGAVASLGGAYIASSGAKSAAKTQAQAAAEAGNQEWASVGCLGVRQRFRGRLLCSCL